MSSAPTSERRIDELDGLRGILAWWVVAGHLLRSLGWRFPPSMSPNRAVDVFIILSGFVIFMLLDRRREPYRYFIARRFFRLFPAWWVALTVSILLIGVVTSATASAPFDASAERRLQLISTCREQLWPHVLIYVSLLQGVVPYSISTGAPWCYVGQAWSVSLEWQFYLLAPLVFLAVRRGHVIVVRSEPLYVHAPHRRPARSRGARARTLTSSG
jgi:peptidoglycan/LPS O-acetylase OafA/YrhL